MGADVVEPPGGPGGTGTATVRTERRRATGRTGRTGGRARRRPSTRARTPRDLRILWWTNAADGLGSQASGIVFPLLLLRLGHGPAAAGAFATVTGLVAVALAPLVAVPADRGHRRRIMIGAAALAAAATALVAAVARLAAPPLWLLLAPAVVERLCAVAYASASRGALARLARPGELTRAAAGLQVGDQTALVTGPALGGALFQLARPLPFLADALTYLATAVGIRSLRTPLDSETRTGTRTGTSAGTRIETPAESPAESRAESRVETPAESRTETAPSTSTAPRRNLRAAAEGLHVVGRSPELRLVAGWTAAASGVVTMLSYTALFVLGEQRGGAATGLVLAASGAAGLVGSLLSVRVVRRWGGRRALVAGTWLLILPCAALATASGPWGYGLAFAAFCLVLPVVTVVLTGVVVAAAPLDVQSRAGAVIGAAAGITAACAPSVAAALITRSGPHSPAVTGAVVLALLAVCTQAAARRALPQAPADAPAPAQDPAQAQDPAPVQDPTPTPAKEDPLP
ncbi:MFS transporter [Streptomyces mangrovisoli]|uniref:MFS transporter n=1 Tax=Streptomyces mangrovisoli TaxID=1428628 RepID=A0A1J4P329_9ACTN|nr:MFS transporter [Streptomyces mangrovisoli]OIJ69151.1 hypothetical protein WN71_004250 [Streptomyces mangrovisoli]